jgi:hypothetical protein
MNYRIQNPHILMAISLFCALGTFAQQGSSQALSEDATGRKLAAIPAEVLLGDGSLRIVNLYKLQAIILREWHDRSPSEIVDRLVSEVYAPYASFWQGYLGDEAKFRKWAATKLLAGEHPIHTRIPACLDLQLDKLFTASASWVTKTSGRGPRGTWYIVFGPGWTNMGGLGDIGMVLDFTVQDPDRKAIEFILPHELTHQVHAARRADPESGTVLDRIISEGLACYAAYIFAAGRQTPAQSVGYTDEEWARGLAHETELVTAASPYLGSKLGRDADRFAARNQRLLDSGPNAAGYFLGFRIMQRYVEKRGAAAWVEAIDLPVREVLLRSGYSL